MSTSSTNERHVIVKKLLKEIHEGRDVKELKERFREILSSISPFEIPIIEQELVKEGVAVSDILKLCDLHVELFRESLESRDLVNVPKGHPIYLLMKENDAILRRSEVLKMMAGLLVSASNQEEINRYIANLLDLLKDLGMIKHHYRKIQMLIFPYLERRGITAIPRVLWGREDQVIVKLRAIVDAANSILKQPIGASYVRDLAKRINELAREIMELVFRENKILYPATLALLSEGEWVAIAQESQRFPWIIRADESEWSPSEKPVLPYELKASLTDDQIAKLPHEFKLMASSNKITPDDYEIKGEDDLDLDTGYLSPEEIKGLFKALPLEITFANRDDRVKYYSESMISHGFVRARTIIGRRVEYCHPPRLEAMVKNVVDKVKRGEVPYQEFWTRSGDRIIRVIIAPVKNSSGEIIGTVEIVEDLTDVINGVEEIKRKILVL